MTAPHSSWASSYDLIYEKSFGSIYKRLTDITLSQIQGVLPAPCDLVDFGAGTGRLSIPLSKLGYRVTAVEPCNEMLIELQRKEGSAEVNCLAMKMQDFDAKGKFDLAMCVFTVLIYLLDEESLRSSIVAASRALRPRGFLLLDIPTRSVFTDLTVSVSGCLRKIEVKPIEGDLYQFSEDTEVEVDGQIVKATDSFRIRYWSPMVVISHLEESGFELIEDVSKKFAGTGSNYLLLRKISP